MKVHLILVFPFEEDSGALAVVRRVVVLLVVVVGVGRAVVDLKTVNGVVDVEAAGLFLPS